MRHHGPGINRRRVDHPHAIAFLFREQPHEISLANNQLRLQHAVGESADDAEADRRLSFRGELEVVADAQVQHVHQRSLIGDRGDRAVLEGVAQQRPRVGVLLWRGRHRRGKGEARVIDKAGAGRDDARAGRPVEGEATGFVTRPQPEASDLRASEDGVVALEAQAIAAVRCVGVVHQRRDRFGHQREAAGA